MVQDEARIIIAGFGGQGVLTAGLVLSYTALFAGKNVSYFPSYGAEQRGGTSNCGVVISERSVIASPVVQKPSFSIIMNLPSALKFIPRTIHKGVALINTSLIEKEKIDMETVKNKEIRLIEIPANELAREVGDIRTSTIVMLGALIKLLNSKFKLTLEHAYKAIEKVFKELKQKGESIVNINKKALEKGFSLL